MAPNHHDFLGVLCEMDEEILTYTSVASGLPFALLTRRAQVVFIEPCCVVKKKKKKKMLLFSRARRSIHEENKPESRSDEDLILQGQNSPGTKRRL